MSEVQQQGWASRRQPCERHEPTAPCHRTRLVQQRRHLRLIALLRGAVKRRRARHRRVEHVVAVAAAKAAAAQAPLPARAAAARAQPPPGCAPGPAAPAGVAGQQRASASGGPGRAGGAQGPAGEGEWAWRPGACARQPGAPPGRSLPHPEAVGGEGGPLRAPPGARPPPAPPGAPPAAPTHHRRSPGFQRAQPKGGQERRRPRQWQRGQGCGWERPAAGLWCAPNGQAARGACASSCTAAARRRHLRPRRSSNAALERSPCPALPLPPVPPPPHAASWPPC